MRFRGVLEERVLETTTTATERQRRREMDRPGWRGPGPGLEADEMRVKLVNYLTRMILTIDDKRRRGLYGQKVIMNPSSSDIRII